MENPDDRTAAINARLDAASPEPWTIAASGAPWRVLTGTEAAGFHLVCETGSTRRYDADLIANAPADLAWLLFERGRLVRAMKSIANLEGIGGDIARKALAGKPAG
jgi:hypothetical protein